MFRHTSSWQQSRNDLEEIIASIFAGSRAIIPLRSWSDSILSCCAVVVSMIQLRILDFIFIPLFQKVQGSDTDILLLFIYFIMINSLTFYFLFLLEAQTHSSSLCFQHHALLLPRLVCPLQRAHSMPFHHLLLRFENKKESRTSRTISNARNTRKDI